MAHFIQKPAQILATLDEAGWLSGETQEFRAWAAASGRWRRYAPGQVIYLAGDAPDGLYGLRHGTLEVSFPLQGVEAVSVHWAEPGFWIGESAFLSGERRAVSVTSESESLLFHIPAAAIERRLAEQPESWHAFFRQSHMNAVRAVRLLAEALALTPRARFARLLLRLSVSSTEVVGTQAALGAAIGIRVTTAKRIVASLVGMGAIRSGYGKVTIVDRAMLDWLANEELECDAATIRPRRAEQTAAHR